MRARSIRKLNVKKDIKHSAQEVGKSSKNSLLMTVLRVAVLSSFVLSVAVTVWILLTHNHMLHILHVILASLTFLLIAVYLLKSAELASLIVHRELRQRMTVDAGTGFIEHVWKGTPVFNACAGVLAKHGIFVKSAAALAGLSKLRTVAIEGNSLSREGYAVTKSTLTKIGVGLSADTSECPVKIVLGEFDPNAEAQGDFVLTSDKITHILIALFVSRVYKKYMVYSLILLIFALAAAAVLAVLNLVMYSAAAIAVWSACEVILIRQIERRTTRLSFDSIVKYCHR